MKPFLMIVSSFTLIFSILLCGCLFPGRKTMGFKDVEKVVFRENSMFVKINVDRPYIGWRISLKGLESLDGNVSMLVEFTNTGVAPAFVKILKNKNREASGGQVMVMPGTSVICYTGSIAEYLSSHNELFFHDYDRNKVEALLKISFSDEIKPEELDSPRVSMYWLDAM